MPLLSDPAKEQERCRKIAAALLGRPLSAAHRKKLSAWHSQKKLSDEHKKSIGAKMRGRKVSAETRAKMSAANKGQKPTASCIQASREARKNGLNLSDDQRRKKSASLRASWDIRQPERKTPSIMRVRLSIDMKMWREKVFKRDNYTCQKCETRGGDMNAHHIKPFCTNPELRFDVDNGLTVCEPCHREIHRGWRADKRIT